MKMFCLSLLFSLVLSALSTAQNVVENPTATQTITQPSGTDLSVVSPGTFTNTQGNDNFSALVNNCDPGPTFKQTAGQNNYYTTAIVGCLDVPSSGTGVPDAFGVMGLVNNANTSVGAAGAYFQGIATGSSFGVWGLNTLTAPGPNCGSGCQPGDIIGYEDDIGPGQSGAAASNIVGIEITGGTGGGTVPALTHASAIEILPSGWAWHYGLITGAGAIDTAAIFLDCNSTSLKNCPSQQMQFQSYDPTGGSGHNHLAALQEDTSGNLDVTFAPGSQSLVVDGNLSVTGTKHFKIDHPLDPANKYLYHTSVESPDMMNIYNGNVALNENGEAEVQLPSWFEALNKDFRYQLSCIGAFAPVYIAQKVQNNRFRIAGGTPGLEVSWQITGIRHDAYAEAHPTTVEEDKTGSERGRYLHPELFGASAQRAISGVSQ